jgi:hypothetical protein
MNETTELTRPVLQKREDPLKRVKPTALNATSDYEYPRFAVTLPVEWTLEDVLDPESWAHVAYKLDANKTTKDPARVGTIIEVRTEDHAWFAELYVRAVRPNALDLAVLRHTNLAPEDKETGNFHVRWNVGKRGFDVIRLSDKTIVASGLPKKEDAHAWIKETMG